MRTPPSDVFDRVGQQVRDDPHDRFADSARFDIVKAPRDSSALSFVRLDQSSLPRESHDITVICAEAHEIRLDRQNPVNERKV